MEKIIGIYKITNPDGYVYIGKSIDIYKRFSSYSSNKCLKQYLLHNSLQEFGFPNHKAEILKECLIGELNSLEKKYISKVKNKSLNIKNVIHDSDYLLHQWNISIGRSTVKIKVELLDYTQIPSLINQ